MTHLRIEQSGITEEVSHSLISKLYELAISGDLDQSSNLMGRLNVSGAKQSWITYLTAQYPDLHITASKLYVDFVDPLVESRLLAFNIGDGTGVTLADMQNATIGTGDVFYNTAITSFDEFQYFTKPSFTNTAQSFCQECKQLTSITYPPQMRVVSQRSHLQNRSLRTIDFRNTVLTTIGGSAFEECTSLESVYLPNTCTSIEAYAFVNNSSLTTIDTSNVVTFGRNAFDRCTALQSIDLSSATSIGEQAFKDCTNLTTVTLNTASTTLGAGCFKGCTALSSIDLSNVTQLGTTSSDNLGQFQGCSSLTSIDISHITALPKFLLYGCTNLQTMGGINSNITELRSASFSNCTNLSDTIDLSNFVTIEGWVFSECTSLTFTGSMDNLVTVGTQAFYNCTGLTGELNLQSLRSLGLGAFKGTGITKIKSLGQITSIDTPPFENQRIFGNCTALVEADLSTTPITSIGVAFVGCTSLTLIKLPSTLTSISDWAFVTGTATAQNRTYVVYATTPPSFSYNTKQCVTRTLGCENNTVMGAIYVPDGYVQTYKTAPGWSYYADVIDSISNMPSTIQ